MLIANLKDNPDVTNLALCLLIQAGIPPHNTRDDSESCESDQYEIESVEFDVHGIVIVNRGVRHELRAAKR